MNKKIKFLSISIIAFVGFFAGANFAFAQTVAMCNSVTVTGTITDTSGVQTNAWFEWGTSANGIASGAGTKTLNQVYSKPQTFVQVISGLNPSTTYYYRAMVSNIYAPTAVAGSVLSFSTPACTSGNTGTTLPTVTTNSASSVSQNSAMLNGYVTPNGANTSAWFEWGTSYSFGNTTPLMSYGTGATSFNNSLSGINSNTTYYYRAVAQNSNGTVYGGTLSFTTTSQGSNTNYSQPYVSTNSASSITQNSASLNGYLTSNGTNTSAWFEWGTSYSLGNATPFISYGTGSTSFYNSLFNLSANTTYYYRAAAQSSYGTVYGSTLSFTTTGQTSSQTYVTTNSASSVSQNSATLNGYVTGTNNSAWFEWGTSYSLGNTTPSVNYGTSGASYNSSISGLNTNTTYYYRAAAQSSYGTVYGSTLSFTTGGQTSSNYNTNTYGYGVAPTASTLLATELTGSTARLNGLVSASGNQSSSAWFEWGTNGSLGNTTQSVNVGALSVVKHSDYLTGLVNGQTYYYRIVAENAYGKVYGSVNSFVSQVSTYVVTPTTTVVNTPTVLRPTTVVINNGGSELSLVTLSIEGGAEMIMSGEKRTYHIAWKNESAQSLKNVVLRVNFPQSMVVDSATRGTFSPADNSVIVDLKTLAPGENGDAFIFTTAGRGLEAGELLVVTANMVYTGTNGVQGDAVAYVIHRAEVGQNAISANIFGAGDFIPTTIFEWILLLILILILVLLGNHLYGRYADERR